MTSEDQRNQIEDGEITLDSGLTPMQVEEEARKIVDKLYAEAFSEGRAMFYKDERAQAPTHFNPC